MINFIQVKFMIMYDIILWSSAADKNILEPPSITTYKIFISVIMNMDNKFINYKNVYKWIKFWIPKYILYKTWSENNGNQTKYSIDGELLNK